jgi:hypothetical protein
MGYQACLQGRLWYRDKSHFLILQAVWLYLAGFRQDRSGGDYLTQVRMAKLCSKYERYLTQCKILFG